MHSGTTTISDDVNVSPQLWPDHVAAVFQAYEDIGIRAMVAPTLFYRPFFRAVPFVDEEFLPDLLRELDTTPMYTSAELLDFARNLARNHHPKEHRVGYMAAPYVGGHAKKAGNRSTPNASALADVGVWRNAASRRDPGFRVRSTRSKTLSAAAAHVSCPLTNIRHHAHQPPSIGIVIPVTALESPLAR